MALCVLSLCPFDISVAVGDFIKGLSQISSFLFCVSSFEILNFCVDLRDGLLTALRVVKS